MYRTGLQQSVYFYCFVFTFTPFVFLCFCVFLVFSSGSADDTAMPGNRKKKKAQKKKHMFLCIE